MEEVMKKSNFILSYKLGVTTAVTLLLQPKIISLEIGLA